MNTQTNDLKRLVDLLDDLEIRAYTLHATDSRYYTDRNPDSTPATLVVDLRLTIVGRTYFEQVCAALGAKPRERGVVGAQRAWWAESDTASRRLLIEGVSFRHHDDWQPTPTAEPHPS